MISNDVTLDPHYLVIDFLAAPEGGEEGKTTKILGHLYIFLFFQIRKKKASSRDATDGQTECAGRGTNER